MSRKLYDAVATVGTYISPATGEEKKRYVTVGAVFQDDKGRSYMKLDALPLSKDWSGFISFYEPKQRDGQDATTKQMLDWHNSLPKDSVPTADRGKAAPTEDFNDDLSQVPF